MQEIVEIEFGKKRFLYEYPVPEYFPGFSLSLQRLIKVLEDFCM
jgi:hypothetical protein